MKELTKERQYFLNIVLTTYIWTQFSMFAQTIFKWQFAICSLCLNVLYTAQWSAGLCFDHSSKSIFVHILYILQEQVCRSTQLQEIFSPCLVLRLEMNFKKSYLFLSLPFAWDALHFHYNSLRDCLTALSTCLCFEFVYAADFIINFVTRNYIFFPWQNCKMKGISMIAFQLSRVREQYWHEQLWMNVIHRFVLF